MTGKNRQPGTGSTASQTSAQRRLSAERSAAARERIAKSRQRRQLTVVGSAVAAVVVVVAALIVVKVVNGSGTSNGAKTTAVSRSVLARIESVPAATFDKVGVGDAAAVPTKINGAALTSGGKPELLYVGAEFCPYCGAERWAVATALARFGTLHNVGQTFSSSSDVYPSTPTLSFHGATLSSTSIAFVGKELESNKAVDGRYQPLDKLTSAEQAIVTKYDAPPYQKQSGTIPFVDIGGKYLIFGAGYNPQVLQGKTHEQIATALSDPTTAIAKSVIGTANLVTAAICSTSGGKPAAVCTSSGVKSAAATLAAQSGSGSTGGNSSNT